MRKFVIGDIHGAYRAFKQCLERAEFNYDNDKLISLGDLCDGWPETRQTMDELLKIKNRVFILGNHDQFFQDYIQTGEAQEIWLSQGGKNTLKSYLDKVPESHLELLNSAVAYHIEDENLFVHAGYNPEKDLQQHEIDEFVWDRSFVDHIMSSYKDGSEEPEIPIKYKRVYLGHTPVQKFGYSDIVKAYNVWLMDTGAGWSGPLTMMNIETGKIIQSDNVPALYPNSKGRYD